MSTTPIPLIRAAADGDAGAVKELLANGADVNARTPVGDTALIRAAFFGHAEVVRVLLAAGADARARDAYDLSAYDWSVRKGLYDVARLLREHAAAGAPDAAGGQAGRQAAPGAGGIDKLAAAGGAGPASHEQEKSEAGNEVGQERREPAGGAHGDKAAASVNARLVEARAMEESRKRVEEALAKKKAEEGRRRSEDEMLKADVPPAGADVRPGAEPEHADGSRQWVWALVALTLVAGVYAGYRINRYESERPIGPAQTGAAVRWERPVTGGAVKGKEVSLPDPQYPAKTELETITGEVTVEVRVDKEGEVVWARAVSGPPPLLPACVKAALESKFSPGIPARRAASASGTITYSFK